MWGHRSDGDEKMNTKKWTVFLVAVLFTMFMVSVPNTMGADNDNFDVTCSGAYLECNILNASWDIGVVQMSTSYWTNETSETQDAETYNSTAGVNLDFEMVISSDAAVWYTVWAENYTTGADQYKLNATSDVWTTQAALNVTTYADVDSDFDPANNVSFDLRFDSPTSTTTGAQQTVTLNGKVTVH